MTDRHKFWLTDEGLDSIYASVMELFSDGNQASGCVAAIRALRDAARAVVSVSPSEACDDESCQLSICKATRALAALLPDEPKGGG